MTLLYQLTPEASKNNAFCWLSWPQVIDWSRNAAVVAMTERWTQIMEERRQAGIDPSNFRGISRRDEAVRDPARFAVTPRGRTPC